ncbi:UNVERIFIED_CONTAM: hypothetical protein GTU68_007932, partial [Idotea baltica]|nr:hypothetical protein [Idotea baltica]
GPSAFSEFETAAVRDVVTGLGARAKAVFSVHSYSQYWMTPYGYTYDLPADYDEMIRVADIGVTALEAVYGTQYEYGNIADIIYEAAGGSIDWTYDDQGIVYSYGLELRDTGEYGFVLPPEQIEPTATESWEGIKAAINAMM